MSKLDKLNEQVLEHLAPDEKVLHSVHGVYEVKIMGNDSIRDGAFFATNQRIVFFSKKLFGFDLEIFPYKNISSVEMSKELMGYRISFFSSGNKVSMKWINSGDVATFFEYVKNQTV